MKKIFVITLALLLTGCLSPSTTRQVTIFYTSDEHGALEARQENGGAVGGAAQVLSILRQEGYEPGSDETLLLSGGDMWTGPAISSWFEGTSTVEVMNEMGYDGAALGNHDFDFGQEVLSVNSAEAAFPFLSANLWDENGDTPPYARPYVIREVNGVQVGIIGLSLQTTPEIVMSSNIAGLTFGEYQEALRETVPQARAAGADLVVVVAHICPDGLLALASTAAELDVSLLAGGHCHRLVTTTHYGVPVVSPGSHWEYVVRVDLQYDTATGQVVGSEARSIRIRSSGNTVPDPGVESIVAGWSAQTDELLGEVIGYTGEGIPLDQSLYNLVTDSWLWYYPNADLAISNLGGFRDEIPPGEITLADIVAVLPFENTLIEVELTGAQVQENLRCCGGAVAGVSDTGSLDPEATYRVLVNSYIYQGGDGYLFDRQDPDAYDTGINWREPVIQWLRAHPTSSEQPLEGLLDDTPR